MIRALVILTLALAGPKVASACAVALAMGLDVSSSVDMREHGVQVNGLADALDSTQVTNAILSNGGVWATAFFWAGQQRQTLMADWTWLDAPEAITAFAQQLRTAPRFHGSWPTALGEAAAFAARLHARAPEACDRHVIDISGDGINNSGTAPDWYRDRGVFDGLVINGLVIRGATPDPYNYYSRRLIHGPNAFVEVAENFDDYPRAIKRKLLRELTPAGLAMETQ